MMIPMDLDFWRACCHQQILLFQCISMQREVHCQCQMHRSPCGVHDIYSFVESRCFGWRNLGDWMIKPNSPAIRTGHGSVSAGYCEAGDGRYSRRKSALEGRCKDVTIFRVSFFVAMMRRKHKAEGRWKSRAVPSFGWASAGNPGAKKSFSEHGSIIHNGLRWEFYPDKNWLIYILEKNVNFKYYLHLLKSLRLWIHVAISSGKISGKIALNCVYVSGNNYKIIFIEISISKKIRIKKNKERMGKGKQKEKEMKRKE